MELVENSFYVVVDIIVCIEIIKLLSLFYYNIWLLSAFKITQSWCNDSQEDIICYLIWYDTWTSFQYGAMSPDNV